MKKRVISLLLTGVLALSMLAGCGDKDAASEETGDNADKAVEDADKENVDNEDAASGESMKITYWGQMATLEDASNPGEYNGDVKLLYKALEIYNERYPEQPLELEIVPGGDADVYTQKLLMAAETDTLPDIFAATSAYMKGVPETGVLLDITEYVEGDSEWMDSFVSGAWTSHFGTTGGKIYGLPTQNEAQGWWYNKTLFDDLGLEIPTTWEDLVTCVETFKEAGITPIAFGAADNWSRWGFDLYCHRYGFYDNIDAIMSGEMKPSEVTLPAIQKIDELAKMGAFSENTSTLSHSEATEFFLNGEAAMITVGSWFTSSIPADTEYEIVFGWGPEFSDSEYDQHYALKMCQWQIWPSHTVGDDPERLERVLNFLKIFTVDEEVVNYAVEESIKWTAGQYTGETEMPASTLSLIEKMEDDYTGLGEMAAYTDPSFETAWWNACAAVITQTATPEEAAQQLDDAMEMVLAQ